MKPILFNTEMVKAILDGRKTQTRRLIKPRYRSDESGFQVITTRSGEFVRVEKIDDDECGIFVDGTERYVNPPYLIGDILYVRETWRRTGVALRPYSYKADEKSIIYKWEPSIHMPKKIARIFLRVTNVRVERLQDMEWKDIAKEGVTLKGLDNPQKWGQYRDWYAFQGLWDGTIKKKDIARYGWEANPWVWVIEFEKCDKPEEE